MDNQRWKSVFVIAGIFYSSLSDVRRVTKFGEVCQCVKFGSLTFLASGGEESAFFNN